MLERAASLQRYQSVQKNADRRGARCAVASNAMYAPCHWIERHGAAINLNMHKDNAAVWRLHCALDSALLGLCGKAVGVQ